MKITFGAVLLIAIIVAAFFFFRSKTGKRVKTRATGTATEAIIKDASTPEGANCKKEKAAPAHKPKYKWGDWKEVYTYFMDPFSRREKLLVYNVRTNGKRVQVEFDGVKAMASCNIEAGDQFDYKFGRELAERRLIAKLIEKRANSYYISKINKTN